jgi:putative phage-type endonuclease
MIQGTQEWLDARLGKLTASRICKMKGTKDARRKLKCELVAERITGAVEDVFVNKAMQWGTDQEPFARKAYMSVTGRMVDEVGLIDHPFIEWAAASPDGIVDDFMLLEIKCPNTATFVEIFYTREIPKDHKLQMLWQLACTGYKSCDYVVYDPRVSANDLIIIGYTPTDQEITALEKEAVDFLAEVNELYIKLINQRDFEGLSNV